MKDSVLYNIVSLIGVLFIIFILFNSNFNTKREKEKFNDVDNANCLMTQTQHNNLKTDWDNYIESSDMTDFNDKYYKKLDDITTNVNTRLKSCYDNDTAVNLLSDGDCPNCEYAQSLFRHVDLDSDHNLGFGAMSSYCPYSLDVSKSQMCLRDMRGGTTDIKKMTHTYNQQLIDVNKQENQKIDETLKELEESVDKKLERDYVKQYLDYHKPFENTVNNYRTGDGSVDDIELAMKIPEYEDPLNSSNNSNNGESIDTMSLEPLFGAYYFDPTHTKAVLVEDKNLDINIQITEEDVNKLISSSVSFSRDGFNIIYNDSEQGGTSIENINEVINTKSKEKAYQITGSGGTYSIYPNGNELYVSVVSTDNILPYNLLQGVSYLLIRE